MDVAAVITQPSYSKNETFANLDLPNTWSGLCTIIGIFVFYSQFLPLYKLDIRPWRYILSKFPQPVKQYKKEDMELVQNLWTPEDQRFLVMLERDILEGLTLVITELSRRF